MITLSEKYGGGIRDLNNNTLPTAIKLLFNNQYLEQTNILSILYFYKKKKKGISFSELLYWITILNSLTRDNEKNLVLRNEYLQNNYLNYEDKLKYYILLLANQKFVDVKVENATKIHVMMVSISDIGIKLVNGLENNYFQEQISKINDLKKIRPYNSKNEKGVLTNQ